MALFKRNAHASQRRPAGRSVWYLIIAILLLSTSAVGVFGKYITTQVMRAQMHSAGFYISSDYLTLNGLDGIGKKTVPVSGWDEGIYFELYNWEIIQGETKITQLDVSYDYALSDAAKAAGWVIAADGEPVAETQTGKVTQKVKLSLKEGHAAKRGDKLEVTVTTGPYKVEMKVIFTLTDAIVPDYAVEDMGPYEHMTIHSNNYAGPVVIRWDESVRVPDMTNPLMAGWPHDGGTYTITVEEFQTYEILFFEEESQEYAKIEGTGITVPVN